jgi:hypothetical protein
MRNLLAILAGFYLAASMIGSTIEKNTGISERSVYEQWCFNEKTPSFHEHILECLDHGGERRVETVRFRIDFTQQRVIQLTQRIESHVCTVFDGDNWKCPLNEGGYLEMTDGEFTKVMPTATKGETPKTYSTGVSWFTHLLVSLKKALTNPF